MSLLAVEKLTVAFPGQIAVRETSFAIEPGETLALVGESGCGKSVTAFSVMRLLPPNAKVASGRILFDGTDLLALSPAEMRAVRGKQISLIQQEPMTSLNPVLTIGLQISEVVRRHEKLSRKQARARAIELLDLVSIPDSHRRIDDYPHNLSGGMRQRVMIAMAVACHPKLLIADEPTTALDVTTQHQILLLLRELVEEFGISLLFVTHDFGVVAELCDDLCVIYAGQTVEAGKVGAILDAPSHPYTRALLACHPDRATSFIGIPGMVPSPLSRPAGCLFAPRCRDVRPACLEAPPPQGRAQSGVEVRCVQYA